jgi:hypothetical protein
VIKLTGALMGDPKTPGYLKQYGESPGRYLWAIILSCSQSLREFESVSSDLSDATKPRSVLPMEAVFPRQPLLRVRVTVLAETCSKNTIWRKASH